MKRRKVLRTIVVLAAGLLATIVWGAGNSQRVLVPQQMVLPFYVTGLGHTGLGPNDWVLTAFYLPPADIPGDYDLRNMPVWDPPVGVDTPFVQGFMVWQTGSPYPVQQALQNVPGVRVPIWFTPVEKFANGAGGYPGMTWTVNSMKAEGSIVGWADFYNEKWEPATTGSHSTVVISGVMEDGRRFWVNSTYTGAWANGHAQAPFCRVQFGR